MGKFIATHLAGTTEKSFATEQEAINYIDSVICEPGCKQCWAEWDIETQREPLVCTYCGINPTRGNCIHPKKCSTKKKIKLN